MKDNDAIRLALALEKIFGLPTGTISQVRLNGSQVDFKLLPNEKGLNASEMIRLVGRKKLRSFPLCYSILIESGYFDHCVCLDVFNLSVFIKDLCQLLEMFKTIPANLLLA